MLAELGCSVSILFLKIREIYLTFFVKKNMLNVTSKQAKLLKSSDAKL